jgi:hypothetical protein
LNSSVDSIENWPGDAILFEELDKKTLILGNVVCNKVAAWEAVSHHQTNVQQQF